MQLFAVQSLAIREGRPGLLILFYFCLYVLEGGQVSWRHVDMVEGYGQ